MHKDILRQQMQQKRSALGAMQIAQTSQSIARHFADHPILAFAPSVAGYMAMRGEVDVMPILAFVTRYDRITALPRTHNKESPLSFHQWKVGDALEPHALGMKEPQADAAALIPDVILTPLLAFDRNGYRLGYGGGYYDRTMAALRASEKPPLFIGVAYSWQEVHSLPITMHDAKLDGILTELGVSLFP